MPGFIFLLAGLALAIYAPRLTGTRRWVQTKFWDPLYLSYTPVRLIRPARVVVCVTFELWAASILLLAAYFAPLPTDWLSIIWLLIPSTFFAGLLIHVFVMIPWAILGLVVRKWSPIRPADDDVKH